MSLSKVPLIAIDRPAFERASGAGALALTVDAEPELFWRVSSSAADIFIGHSDDYVVPEAFEVCEGCVVGANEWLFLVRAAGVVWRIHLAGRFYTIVQMWGDEMIVQHEIGFTRVSCDGQVKADIITGLLSSYRIDDDLLTFETLEGETGALRL